MTKDNEYMPSFPDSTDSPLLGLASAKSFRDIGFHAHQKAQLLYIQQGFIKLYLEDSFYLIPKGQAILIPAGIQHRAWAQKKVSYINLYFHPNIFNLPPAIKLINVSPLLQAAIIKVPHFPDSYSTESPSFHLARVIVDEINEAEEGLFFVPLPTDKRCEKILYYFENAKDKMPTLESISKNSGASPRTITRIFQKETGMSFEKWRQKYFLLRALMLLSEGHSTTTIAQELGYSNDSAFIAMFKRLTGKVPSHYRTE